MSLDAQAGPERLRDRFAGQHLLITGSTGFLAKAFIEKLLRALEDVGGLYLMIRPRSGGAPPERRLQREVLASHAFDRLRAALGERFAERCRQKIHVVPGDLSRDCFGLDTKDYEDLTHRITAVVNSAATVTFDERLDLAVELNSLGPSRLLQFAKQCGDVPFLHVSTCYVCGMRRGAIVEDFSAPEIAREKLPRRPDSGDYDLDALIESLRTQAREICEQYDPATEDCRRRLIDAGMSRSRELGWSDTYTFTKWIGEQLLVRDRGRVPLAVFRPAIIESSYEEPLPGWIDGLRMADPMIAAFGKRKLKEFPARPELPLDLIPVDLVANAMVATMPLGAQREDRAAVYHCASSGRNPMLLSVLAVGLSRAFMLRPMNDDRGRPISIRPLRLVDAEWFQRKLEQRRRRVQQLRSLLERVGAARATVRRLAGVVRQLEQLAYFSKIYAPYTHLDVRFADDNLQHVADSLHPEDREQFRFDVGRIDWLDYLVNRHVPGLRSYVLGTGGEPSARLRAVSMMEHGDTVAGPETLRAENIFDVLGRVARRFPDKPVFQIRRDNRWIRYTYEEAVRATGTIARRLQERGLAAGDRVAICAENGPEWGLAYFAIMRAGMTAVPLDPQLSPEDAWSAARFAEAKLMLAGRTTRDGLERRRHDDDALLVVLTAPFVPPPAASRDPVPPPEPAAADDVASILFTSGTTVAPKAVQLSHRNLLSNAAALVQVHPAYPTDELLSVLPLYHAFEFTGGFLVPIASGATITYVEHLKGPEIRAAMQASGTTLMLVVPRLLRMFHDAVMSQLSQSGSLKRGMFRVLSAVSKVTGGRAGRALFRSVHRAFGGHLRMFVSGGSRLDPELFDWFWRIGLPVYEGYGLTETAPVVTVCPPGSARRGSVGPALPNVDVEIRHANLEGIGEVWVRGPSVMRGYLKNEEATSEILVDGWLRTGDLGRLDDNGFLFLTGRSKDLIITAAGKNVYPDEVEARYREVPFVKELCVFGMPARDGLGDVVHAVIVPDRDAAPELDRSSLERTIRMSIESLSDTLPEHQRIAVLHFWERDLPRTTTLKAKRSLIRQTVDLEDSGVATTPVSMDVTHEDQEDAEALLSENPDGVASVFSILSSQSRRAAQDLHPRQHLLLDLGIDSIGKIDVLGQIEACFDMRIGDEQAAKVARVGDLLRIVGRRLPKTQTGAERTSWQRRLAEPETAEKNGKMPAALMPLRWAVRGGMSLFLNSYVRVRAVGRENIPAEGAFILTPNHGSHLDSPAVLIAVGGRRRVWVAGAEDYFFNSALKRFLFGKVLDTIAVDRQADGFRGLRRCSNALRQGEGLLIFPEGTRTLTGQIQPFKIGAAVLAIERQVPIVPVHIDRSYQLFRKGQRFIRPGVITVAFGEPVPPLKPGPDDDHYAAFHELTERVEGEVHRLRAGTVAG
ncbi:MAG: AMP-binding protein [Phycisphaerae bacterium]|nr:AMP-binding protein [Phycisphaerae bacterium]